MSDINGIVNLLKPPGISSFMAVKSVKKILDANKAGHTGTLDPSAAGVLPLCMGQATKIIPYLPEKDKEYIAEITLGVETDTLDREGNIINKNDKWHRLNDSDILKVLKNFEGDIKQVPPMFSAVHYQGKRLYELARKGEVVKRKARDVVIKKILPLEIKLPIIRLRVVCSRGTYIRSLARDIGNKLKTGAFLSFLIRTRSGIFNLEESFTFEEIEEFHKSGESSFLLNLDYPINYKKVHVQKKALDRANNGNILKKDDFSDWNKDIVEGDELISVYSPDGEFISINELIIKDNYICCKPRRVFR